jgi:hypothetical protein
MGRILTVASLVPWLAVSSVIAREHVHESRSAGRPPLAHSHFSPHSHDDHDSFHLDHDGAEVSDVDEDVVWINDVGLAQSPRSFPPALIVVAVSIPIVPDRLVRVAVVADEATLAHGPPRATLSLRAPPSSSPLI